MNKFIISPMSDDEIDLVTEMLSLYDLDYEHSFDYTAVIKHLGMICGTCSFEKNTIKAFAVKKCFWSSSAAKELLTHILNQQFDRGYYTSKIFTQSENRVIFEQMQFKCIYDSATVVVLIYGVNDFETYLNKIINERSASVDRGALVMNCNPFTLGHQKIIEQASKACDEVIVFVVEEDKSMFPFKIRLDLVQKGVEHLSNVHVIPSGDYMVSAHTFPDYFKRKLSSKSIITAELDAGLFASIIAKRLHIKKRYVAREPYCELTSEYNKVMARIFPKFGVELIELKRFEYNEKAVSASQVRALLESNQLDQLKNLVPDTTYQYLMSKEMCGLIDKLIKGAVH